MFFLLFKILYIFVSPKKFRPSGEKKNAQKKFALRAKKHLKNVRPSGEKTKTKMWASRRKTLATVVDVVELSLFWRLESARSAIFFYIWGYLSKKKLFRASKQSLKYLQNTFNFPQNLDFCFTKTYKIFSKMFKNFPGLGPVFRAHHGSEIM